MKIQIENLEKLFNHTDKAELDGMKWIVFNPRIPITVENTGVFKEKEDAKEFRMQKLHALTFFIPGLRAGVDRIMISRLNQRVPESANELPTFELSDLRLDEKRAWDKYLANQISQELAKRGVPSNPDRIYQVTQRFDRANIGHIQKVHVGEMIIDVQSMFERQKNEEFALASMTVSHLDHNAIALPNETINRVNIANLESKFKAVPWHNEQTQNLMIGMLEGGTPLQRDVGKYTSILKDLAMLEATEAGKKVADLIRYKYWTHTDIELKISDRYNQLGPYEKRFYVDPRKPPLLTVQDIASMFDGNNVYKSYHNGLTEGVGTFQLFRNNVNNADHELVLTGFTQKKNTKDQSGKGEQNIEEDNSQLKRRR